MMNTGVETVDVVDTINQNVMIRNHLLRYGSITPLDAVELYGILRLSARIWDLRHQEDPAMDIVTFREDGTNRFGHKVRYARYFLKGVKDINA